MLLSNSLSLSLFSNFSWKYEDPMEILQFYNFLEGFEDCEKDSKVWEILLQLLCSCTTADCYIGWNLKYFFDILTKVGCIVHERTGVYSKHFTPRKERNAFNLGRWNFSRTFLLDASLLRACFKYERNYHTKRDSVVKISGRKTWKKRERENSWWSRNDLICRKIIRLLMLTINMIE